MTVAATAQARDGDFEIAALALVEGVLVALAVRDAVGEAVDARELVIVSEAELVLLL